VRFALAVKRTSSHLPHCDLGLFSHDAQEAGIIESGFRNRRFFPGDACRRFGMTVRTEMGAYSVYITTAWALMDIALAARHAVFGLCDSDFS